DGPPRKRPRLIEALDDEQVFDDSTAMGWTDQEKGKEQRLALFKGLKVAQFDWFMKLHLGNWPVIYVSFKDLNYKSWESMLNSIRKRISDLYKEHSYILDNKKLREYDEPLFKNIINGTIKESDLMDALSDLARHLHNYFGKQTIILIDEYNWPMEYAE
ncbi:15681_t:CDS:2, partial [Racocetra persica]